MATKLANALRTQAAIDRITAAVRGVTGKALDLPIHRDPDIERALHYEAIAGALEATSPKRAPVVPATPAVPADAVGSMTVETIEIVPDAGTDKPAPAHRIRR